MFRRNPLLRVSTQWPETVAAAMARKRPKSNQIDREGEAAAQAANAEPTLWSQFWDNELVVSGQEYLWTNYSMGAADVAFHTFSILYVSLSYYDNRTRFKKSKFTSLFYAVREWLPWWVGLWFMKKYYAYIMDVPSERGGVPSTSPLPPRRSVRIKNEQTGEMEMKESNKSDMKMETEAYQSRMRDKLNEKQ